MWLWWLACSGPGTGDAVTGETETGLPEATGDTGGERTTDTGPPVLPPALDAVSAELHPVVESIVVVRWEQDTPADLRVEYSFDPGVWLSSPLRSLDAGPHEELLLGVPYDTEVTWRLVAEGAGGATTTPDEATRTAPLPPTLPVPTVLVDDAAGQDPASPYVFTSMNEANPGFNDRYWAMILDRRGRVVWGLMAPRERIYLHARTSLDGRSLLLDHNSFWATFDLGAASTIERTLIDGTVVETFRTPGLHHPFTELPDGSIAYGASSSWTAERIAVVRADGTTSDLWDCNAWLAPTGVFGGCASNTLNYDAATNTLLFSLYSVETVVEIDVATGEALRWFGHVPGAYAFSPAESTFYWQHGGHWTSAGTFLTSSLTAAGDEIVVREYAVDPLTETLSEVWSFGVGDGLLGEEMGEAHRLANGNTLHNTGSLPRLREARPDGVVVWDVEWAREHAIGRSTVLHDLYALAPERP